MPNPGRPPNPPRRNPQAGPPPAEGPTRLPLPQSVTSFWNAPERSAAFGHPVYALLRAIRWHDGWQYDAPRGSRALGVKAAAYRRAEQLFGRPEMERLSRAVRERRAAWVEPHVRHGLARRLLLRSTTDFVLHLSSAGPLELGLAVHHVYGFPYIPGTAIKGLAHAVAAAQNQTVADGLYGLQDAAGHVAILDGLPVKFEVRRDVMTPHFPKWYQNQGGAKPDDKDNPVPIPFLSVAAGSEFEVVLIARSADTARPDLDAVEDHIRQGCRERGLGAKTSAGYGAFDVTALERPAGQADAGVGHEAPVSGGAEPASPRAGRSQSAGSRVHALIEQVQALPVNRIPSEINTFVDECLKIDVPADQKALALAIVQKVGVSYIRGRIRDGKRPEQWRRILELAGIETG
jgi:CRISPR-associated protein Cmr6